LGDRFTLWLREKGIGIIPVSIEDALSLGCNLLSLGDDRVIVPQHCTAVRDQLSAEGLDVLSIELDMFTPGGGGVHCLTQPLSRDL
jgi:N-dimethylarginine dimethylaminohydrolase